MLIEYFMEWVQTAPVKKREAAAGALVRAYLNPAVEQEERDDLEAALTILTEDNAPTVRLAVAEEFGAFADAPRHIMLSLAADTTDIAVVAVSRSPVFHDTELMSLFETENIRIQVAASCRPWLSADLITTICNFGCKEAVFAALENPVGDFHENDLHQVALRFGDEANIRSNLLTRKNLTTRSRHILIAKLGDALGGFVKKKSWLSEERAEQLVGEAYDRASIIFAAGAREEDISCVVNNLMEQERLTVAFLVRAICMGNISLVASALSELSGVRFARVEAILTRNRKSAFRAVYDRAGLPQSAFLVFQTAISAWRRLLSSNSKTNKARLPFIVTREVLEAYNNKPELVDHELLALLRRLSAETARENSKVQASEISARKRLHEKRQQVQHAAAQRAAAKPKEPQPRREADGVAPPEVIELIEAEFADRFEGLIMTDEGAIPAKAMNDKRGSESAIMDQLSSGLLYAPDVRAA